MRRPNCPQQGPRVTSPGQSAPIESAPIMVEAAPNAPATVLPSRAFLPPHDIPPEDFAAYGIVAFSQEATSSTTRRHILVCEAFVPTLPAASLTQVPPKQQMVTVWPVDSEPIPAALEGRKVNAAGAGPRHFADVAWSLCAEFDEGCAFRPPVSEQQWTGSRCPRSPTISRAWRGATAARPSTPSSGGSP
jgi:hypothetical protein